MSMSCSCLHREMKLKHFPRHPDWDRHIRQLIIVSKLSCEMLSRHLDSCCAEKPDNAYSLKLGERPAVMQGVRLVSELNCICDFGFTCILLLDIKVEVLYFLFQMSSNDRCAHLKFKCCISS